MVYGEGWWFILFSEHQGVIWYIGMHGVPQHSLLDGWMHPSEVVHVQVVVDVHVHAGCTRTLLGIINTWSAASANLRPPRLRYLVTPCDPSGLVLLLWSSPYAGTVYTRRTTGSVLFYGLLNFDSTVGVAGRCFEGMLPIDGFVIRWWHDLGLYAVIKAHEQGWW